MLRAVFLQNGTQKILEHVDLPKLTYFNMKEAGAETTDSKLNEIRAELAHKQYQADCWPLFDLYLTDTIDKSILHFSIDMLLSDFISMKTILNDLDAFYYEDGKNLKPLQVSFRDVLVYQKEHENDEEVRTKKDRDCEYWKKRLQNFPDAPELPILPESKCEKVTFTQYRHFITPENWSKLCEKARMQRLTPSGVVLSAYAEIIGRWSKRKDFCIDITILNRPSIHSQINEIVGDFTEVDILEISPEYPSNFVERTRKIQNQLWEDLSHSAFTGIDVLREINRQSEKKAIIPVVYTSTVGAADSEQQENWEFMRNSRITYKISQTPQVWIDCQVSEDNGGVLINFPLKVVLLSGDWIPVTLPDQIHTSCKKAKVVSLGGATEAAIWSIYHEIEEVPDGAVSIPYGKPLANQKFYVLNEKMEQCPDWVPGDLYIGGKGLALEYLNKPEETNAHFMYDEQLQERIYKTGDIGRYWPDGTIEFMGREDTQVKIHGHRIELSEIESALLSNTLVKTAVAVIVGKRPQDYKIVAFVEGNIEVSELTEYIKTQVPEYMVPSRFEVNEKIPLSANGKVERKALKKLAETYFQNTGKCEMPPHEGLEKEIAELWKTLLKIDRVNRTDNFYDIGGDSLLVAQAVSKTKEAINVAKDVEWDRLMIGMLQNPTIMDFAQFLNSVQIGTSHEENEISETPLNIIADIPEGGEVMKVFFPGGIGFLQQFNTLFQILVNNPERTEGIAAFNYTEDKEYLDSEEKDHIVTIGRRYADLLLNSGYRKFKLIGYCMGGLVAIEAARALLEAGAEVLPVVTIDTIPIVLEMEGDLLMERSYGLMVGADVSKAGHVKRDELVQMALELLKDHNNGFIEEDAILGLTGELSELAACYKKQKTLSKRERMENLKNAIPENSMQLSSEDMNRFNELFEIYKRNYRCAIGYTPKPFAGDLQALSCMDDHSPFVPVMKPGTEAFLSKCALGNLEVLPIGGNHLSCLMTPNVEGMANLLDGKGERV